MKFYPWLLPAIVCCILSTGCNKSTDLTSGSSVFLRMFPSDTSYQTGGAFQLADGNFVVYGFPPENNSYPPLIIKCDSKGTIIWKNPLSPAFHYCTVKSISISDSILMAVGTTGTAASVISVCRINASSGIVIEGSLKNYTVPDLVSGPLMPPLFERAESGSLLIAGTIENAAKKEYYPFALPVDENGVAKSPIVFDFNIPGWKKIMTRGLCKDDNGYTISGSTYNADVTETDPINSFCLRLDNNYNELWHTFLTDTKESISTKRMIVTESESSIILFGSRGKSTYANTNISDLIGTLYTQQLDMEGNLSDTSGSYADFMNLGHAGGLAETSDGGYIMSATTNEMIDIYLVSSNHMYLLKLGKDLNEEWHREFKGFNAFTAVSVEQTKDGGYLIGGYEHSGTFIFTMCLIKTDADGNIVLQ